jgi:hypothetical protein
VGNELTALTSLLAGLLGAETDALAVVARGGAGLYGQLLGLGNAFGLAFGPQALLKGPGVFLGAPQAVLQDPRALLQDPQGLLQDVRGLQSAGRWVVPRSLSRSLLGLYRIGHTYRRSMGRSYGMRMGHYYRIGQRRVPCAANVGGLGVLGGRGLKCDATQGCVGSVDKAASVQRTKGRVGLCDTCTHTHRERERERERERLTERETNTHTHRERERERERVTDRRTDRQTDRDRERDRETERQREQTVLKRERSLSVSSYRPTNTSNVSVSVFARTVRACVCVRVCTATQGGQPEELHLLFRYLRDSEVLSADPNPEPRTPDPKPEPRTPDSRAVAIYTARTRSRDSGALEFASSPRYTCNETPER